MKRSLSPTQILAALVALVLTAAINPVPVSAQGFLIEPANPHSLPRWVRRPIVAPPTAPTPYAIQSLEVDATINGGVAKVDVSQTFKNEGSSTIETAFVFPLPYDGAIEAMTLLVNGKEYPAKLLDAKEARSAYEAIVRKNRDPALLEWIGTGMFQTSVFPIPAGETRTVTISYSQLLRTGDGLVEFLFPTGCAKYTSKPIGKTSFNVTIVGDSEIKNVYSPAHDLKIDRNGKNVVKASVVLENKDPGADFRLFFDQSADELTAKVQSYRPDDSKDGFFLMLASPKIEDDEKTPLPKTIILTLDVSGSMMGKKIEQARDSLKYVLERLRDGDKFNIVLFSNDARLYKPELQVASPETRAEALAYASAVRATGGTDIEDALKVSFAQFDQDDSANPKYFVFLSDGEPTVKERNEMKLAELARTENKTKARVFTFGVGHDVHSRLLDRFVRDGRGSGEYVKPEENIEDRVSKLYSRIETPVFSDVSFEFVLKDNPDEKYFTNLVYPSDKTDVFAGEQLVVVGRYSKPGAIKMIASGKVGEKDVKFEFDGELTAKSPDSSYSYVERLWAVRRVGEIVDQLDLNGENKELLDELLNLAKEHGILTPYTSFLADDSVALNDNMSNARIVASNVGTMQARTSDASGFAQRSLKQNYRSTQSLASLDDSASESMELAMSAAPGPVATMGGGMGSMGGGMGSTSGSGMTGGRALLVPRSAAKRAPGTMSAPSAVPETKPIDAIRKIAGKTFYFKEGRWIDASIDEEMEKNQKPIEVAQFGDKYFELVGANGREFSQYLVFSEPVTLNYNGQIYKIDPQK
ncbi:MAG: VWA domain-containing protein [Thermoguttaceae bacterium]|nr:VWA domain-containing protein [Thermoguttaceae bacterium]